MEKSRTIIFGTLAVLGRVGIYIVTPLWLDSLRPGNDTINSTSHQVYTDVQTVNPVFLLVCQWSFLTLVFGLCWFCSLLLAPRSERRIGGLLPTREIVIIGLTSGVSSVLFNFSMSGKNTPLYLQAILSNCNIPIQFLVRFLLLRRRPTWIKLLCAVVVALCEFVCLIPSIFPKLEPDKAHQSEGGRTGAWTFLWPMFMVASQVPFAVANSLMEKSVQAKKTQMEVVVNVGDNALDSTSVHLIADGVIQDEDRERSRGQSSQDPPSRDQGQGQGQEGSNQISLLMFLFWWPFFATLTAVALFWVDLIPTFGTSSNIGEFAESMKFNVLCLFGQAGCGPEVYLLGYSNFIVATAASLAFAGLMRFSEGANFVIILLTLRTPLVFLFWALFQESPFRFSPHAYLSTWLSIGAIVVMIPAVIIYDQAPAEKVGQRSSINTQQDDTRGLLEAAEPTD